MSDLSRTAEVTLAAVGAGKTEAALTVLVDTLARHPFARTWVLLATRRQEDDFRQRLVQHEAGQQVYFNVEFFDFYALYRRILNMAGQPARGLSETARAALLRAVMDDLSARGALTLYARIAGLPGFVRVVAGLIAELKQNGVRPEAFTAAAEARGLPKDRDLARIYAAYQERLQTYDLVDREGEGWLALAQLEEASQPHLCADLDLLLVDGYDQFTPVQARLLRLLAGRAGRTLITLTTVPGREATIGRRFADALVTLTQAADAPLSTRMLTGTGDRPAGLAHLIGQIFMASPPPLAADESVHFLEAPDPGAEVGMALRRVKRLLLDGTPPDQILIALRDWALYQPSLLAYARAYGLPLALHYGESLASHPLTAVLLDALTLHSRDFPRRPLLDLLHSPYVQVEHLGEQQIRALEAVSQRFTITRGRDLWLNVLTGPATRPAQDSDGETLPPLLTPDDGEALAATLDTLFAYLTPEPEAAVSHYVQWLEDLIGPDPANEYDDAPPPAFSLNLIAGLRAADDDMLIARDLLAVQEIMRVLRGLLTAQELLVALDPAADRPVKWARFHGDLLAALDAASLNPRPARSGRVLVTSAADARGLPHDHVFILGLAEGVFPARVSEDPLYLDTERAQLTALGVPLRTQAERVSDDGIFYELICLPRRVLTLSRPTTENGQPWPASHLWRAALAVYDPPPAITHLRIGQVVPPDEVAALAEAALTAADALSAPMPDEAAAQVYNWLLQAEPMRWTRLHQARMVEARRLSRSAPHDAYSGVLADAALLARVAEALDDRHQWSASQLDAYAACGFRFFAGRLLNLAAFDEPEEGMNILQRGALVHRILHMTYQAVQREQLAIHPTYTEAALALLEAEAEDVLRTAPQDFAFRPTALWDVERAAIRRRLRRLIEQDFSADNPIHKAKEFQGLRADARYPFALEAAFGPPQGDPVEVALPDGQTVRLRGVIDRIDRVETADGDRLVVVDYKTGTTRYSVEEMEAGRSFQMVLYLLAAEKLYGAPVAGGLFWHTPNNAASGVLSRARQDVIDAALGHLARYLDQMRAGDFAVEPGKPDGGRCVRYCDFPHLCRLCGFNLRKR